MQENYAADIKEHGALNPLLEFTFEFLEKGGKLIDASKFKVKTFELDESESSEKEIQWLLVHLYFLSLKHLPILTKSWWLDSKKKIKGLVEAWTEKYVRQPERPLGIASLGRADKFRYRHQLSKRHCKASLTGFKLKTRMKSVHLRSRCHGTPRNSLLRLWLTMSHRL